MTSWCLHVLKDLAPSRKHPDEEFQSAPRRTTDSDDEQFEDEQKKHRPIAAGQHTSGHKNTIQELSQRRIKAIQERPVWAETQAPSRSRSIQDPTLTGSVSLTGHGRRSKARESRAAVQAESEKWPDTPPLRFTNRGVMNLLDQDDAIIRIIRTAFTKVIGDALFRDAFPDIGDRLKYARDALYSVSKELCMPHIRVRIKEDNNYATELGKVVDARWTVVRNRFKTAAGPAATHAFDLKPGCSERIHKLVTSTYNDYIYPFKEGSKDTVDYSKPFGNPAIIEIIRQCMFIGKASAIYAGMHQSRFPITDGDKPERMVAEALAALSATALCAVLQEWQGPQHVNNDFNANLFAETYAHHIGFLQDLKAKSIKACEKSLVHLYREASGQGKVFAHRPAVGANALAHLNFAELEADSD
ncbi:hypothetical protein B0H10DRAFT_1959126 [Mycena sp. CBHHK59/15]|nr:hypothetical protein B0H10DRAFT_1959126 [Mycena sp. CBHHK59/15]